jgi:16S rRNA (cytosine967-C5)-methyltransferase
MSRYYSYINTAAKILQSYNGEMPFSFFIKQFFAKEKKYGSKDRKQIAALCYSWFRVGLALKKNLTEENIIKAFFISNHEPSALIQELKPEWNNAITNATEEKIAAADFSVTDIFPFKNELNDAIDFNTFCKSFLTQPEVFVRIRPQNKNAVAQKIKATDVECNFLNNDNAIQFSSGTNIEKFLAIDKEVVIQDYNSQQVLNYLSVNNFSFDKKEIAVWDCCAASGGKSILLYDLLNEKIKLTVSDIRQSIIANLQQRFKNAGIKNYHHFIADISNNVKTSQASNYDIIICDAPCTGSGTWSRTPEQLYFFNQSSIEEFSTLQKKIATNVLQHLNNNGLFFYITCSVFKKENEEVVEHISKLTGVELIEMKNLFGYEMKADSMFVAVFQKR